MAEPTTTSGVSLTALLIAVLGPLAGQYTVIVMAALAGAMWPLSTMDMKTKIAGAAFLFRIVSAAVILSGSAAFFLEQQYGYPVIHGMAVVAFVIGAMGNGWTPVFRAMRDGMSAFLRAVGAGANGSTDK
jgi:uncharacterized membrane protein YkvI